MAKNIFIIASCMIFALALFFLISGLLAFQYACKKHGNGRKKIKFERYGNNADKMRKAVNFYKNLPYEEIVIPSSDGICLYAKYIQSDKASNKLIIFFHGYHSSDLTEISLICPLLLESGYSMLIPDQRAHGMSDGKYVTFGALERFDCKAWCEYAVNRFGNDTEIYLYGISMGASTVLLSASLNLPSNIKAIAADCGFDSPWNIIKRTLRRSKKLPPYPLIYFMNYWSKQLANFDFRECSTVESAKESYIPTLYIHGKEDKYVPSYMSKRAFDASKDNCKLLLFDNARHIGSYLSNPDKYFKELIDFFENSCI